MNTTEIIVPESQSISLIREAMSAGADPAYLRELLAVRREWEADEARKSYFHAISEFQKRAPIIEKADKAYDKMYARMDRIWRTVRPLFTELGLSCTWQVCEIRDGLCHVEGQLAHVHGHSVPLVMDIAIPEILKGQNAAQQIGSARTYIQRYAFCSALGIVTGEDDDGTSAGTQYVTREQVEELSALLEKCPKGTIDSLLEWAECDGLSDIPASKFGGAKKALQAKVKA